MKYVLLFLFIFAVGMGVYHMPKDGRRQRLLVGDPKPTELFKQSIVFALQLVIGPKVT